MSKLRIVWGFISGLFLEAPNKTVPWDQLNTEEGCLCGRGSAVYCLDLILVRGSSLVVTHRTTDIQVTSDIPVIP